MSKETPDFASALRGALARQKIPRKDFAQIVGVSANTVSSWVQGQYLPKHQHMVLIGEALGLTLDELHGRPGKSAETKRADAEAAPSAAEAHDILQRLAGLDADQPLVELQRVSPDLLRVLAEARAHVSRYRGPTG